MPRPEAPPKEDRTQSTPGSHPVDEHTHLLPKTLSHVPKPFKDGREHEQYAEINEKQKPRKLYWILLSIFLSNFVTGLDGTVMATLSVPVATSFHSLPLLSWLATAYLITVAAIQPLCGRLTDIYSRRTGMLLANLLFGLGNLFCGFAVEKWMMIAGRLLAGLGGGALNAVATIMISDYIPLRQRGLWQGMGNLCWGLGNGLGGVFGGYCNDVWGWDMAFLAQTPLTMFCIALVYFDVDKNPPNAQYESHSSKSSIRRVDFLGSFLLVATLVVFLLGINTGPIATWNHPLVITSFVISAPLFCLFVYVEERVATEPIIPIRLIFDRTVACGCLANWLFSVIVYALLYYIPIYFRVRGKSSTDAGAALVPFSIFNALGSFGAGMMISKMGNYRFFKFTCPVVMLAATILISLFNLTTATWLPLLCMGLVGVSFGGMIMVTLLALFSAVETADQAVVTSLSYTFRSTGAVMGVALASAIFQHLLRTSLWAQLGNRENGAEIIGKLLHSLNEIDRLPALDQSLARQGYMHALTAIFIGTVVLAVLGLISASLIRELKLYGTLTRDDANDPETATMAH